MNCFVALLQLGVECGSCRVCTSPGCLTINVLVYRGKAVVTLMTAGKYIFTFRRLAQWLGMSGSLEFVCFRASDRVSIPLLGPCHQEQDNKERHETYWQR